MTGQPCDIPGASHDGAARLYPGGWLCTAHAPKGRPVVVPAAAAASSPARHRTLPTAPCSRQVTAALRIDFGTGFEIKDGDRAGQIWWKTDPHARYECVACQWRSDNVTGAAAVQNFTDHIRTTHQAVCPAAATQQGAHAA
ncbi:hypothetical protein ACFWIB_15445 [Streptomyces sp. NPDC127051]|uniref:hypothetical protein n=1 Tax=Streptomyces sp. NPDC127051 TaxID=3347119 RepID=UPI003646CA74